MNDFHNEEPRSPIALKLFHLTPDQGRPGGFLDEFDDLFTHVLDTVLVGNSVHFDEVGQIALRSAISIFADTAAVEESDNSGYTSRVIFW